MLTGHLLDGSLEIGHLADDVQISLVVQQSPQAPPQTGMVVGEHDTSPPITAWAFRRGLVDGLQVAHALKVGPGTAPDDRLSVPLTHGEIPNPFR